MENKNKKIITLLMVFSVIFTVIGSTLAYWNWETTEGELTGVTFTVTSEFSCSADGGNELNSNSVMLAPATCDNENYAIKREITLDRTIADNGMKVYTDLWLDVKTLDSGLKNSENFKWVFTTDENSCSESSAISYGTFTGLVTNDKVMLLNSEMYTDEEEDTYYLYIWLDKAETSTSTMDQDFEFKINGECRDFIEPEVPVLDDGLIPVILSDDTTNEYKVTATTVDDPDWYNYENKQWANAVLVKDEEVKTREENSVPTTEIDTSDILAYFVWIPRYAYQIWTLAESSTGSEQQIAIEWESTDASYRAGTQVGEYRTHPAFWRDNNSDNVVDTGETIAGIWVGKFETTGTDSTPTILPNKAPLVNKNVSTWFQIGLKFAGGTLSNGAVNFSTTNSYGMKLTLTSHMMKNSEWGAVAYLSHSEYGVCQNGECEEIRINNYYSSGKKTGCGALKENAGQSSTCSNAYGNGINEYPQSTTGNITGIFDMSGGSPEYVMGVFEDSQGQLSSGRISNSNSGFNGLLESGRYESGIAFPIETKNYDKYQASSGTTISPLTACNGGRCYGHALSETKSWYDDYFDFVSIKYPWFRRDASYSGEVIAGIFNYNSDTGGANDNFSFRTVLSTN